MSELPWNMKRFLDLVQTGENKDLNSEVALTIFASPEPLSWHDLLACLGEISSGDQYADIRRALKGVKNEKEMMNTSVLGSILWQLSIIFTDIGHKECGHALYGDMITRQDPFVDEMIAQWHEIGHPHINAMREYWLDDAILRDDEIWDRVERSLKILDAVDGGLGRTFI